MSAAVLTPIRLRNVELRNRIAMGPMMQYSAADGVADVWHLTHLGSRATGGAGLVMVEQTAVCPEGRSTHGDLGLWRDDQAEALARIADFIGSQGAVPGIQIGHSGRKASIRRPWEDRAPFTADQGGWDPVAPSALSCGPDRLLPRALKLDGIRETIDAFSAAAGRARQAGFRVIEVHAAHGYLAHQFLSPIANVRTDQYGGDFDGRTRFIREVVAAVRASWPSDLPLAVKLSAQDDAEGGWQVEDTARLIPLLQSAGVDLFDISTGGIGARHRFPTGPAALASVARQLRDETGACIGVGWGIDTPDVAEAVISAGDADIVFVARAMLSDPYWANRASQTLGGGSLLPRQIRR